MVTNTLTWSLGNTSQDALQNRRSLQGQKSYRAQPAQLTATLNMFFSRIFFISTLIKYTRKVPNGAPVKCLIIRRSRVQILMMPHNHLDPEEDRKTGLNSLGGRRGILLSFPHQSQVSLGLCPITLIFASSLACSHTTQMCSKTKMLKCCPNTWGHKVWLSLKITPSLETCHKSTQEQTFSRR